MKAGLLPCSGVALLGLIACGPSGPVPVPIDAALPVLPGAEPARDGDGRPVIRVAGGRLSELEGHRFTVEAGPQDWLVLVEDAPTTGAGEEVVLWLRGHGARRVLLPEIATGPVRLGTQETWAFDLAPGDYQLSLAMGRAGAGSARVSAR
jgi:hypothetical protein